MASSSTGGSVSLCIVSSMRNSDAPSMIPVRSISSRNRRPTACLSYLYLEREKECESIKRTRVKKKRRRRRRKAFGVTSCCFFVSLKRRQFEKEFF